MGGDLANEDADNEYLREFLVQPERAQREMAQPGGDYFAWLQKPTGRWAFDRRRAGVRRYAFGVPNRAALNALAACSPLVELGAGTGYWAYLLRARGADVVAYDLAPPDRLPNAYRFEPHTWTRVLQGGVEVLDRHADRTLFLCWPGYRDAFADQALAAYAGSRLVYVGEDAGGNTANADFFDRLARAWSLDRQISLPQWPGAHDLMRIYHRQ